MSTGHDENYDRCLWQSARTKDGQRGELPYDYNRAWEAAHLEERLRNVGALEGHLFRLDGTPA